jgi:hypothetical protein
MTKPIAFTLLLAALGACGSDDPITALDRDSDCSHICEKYRDCASSNYDVNACEDRCQDMVSNKDTARIDDCRDCVNEKSCVGSAFDCASECVGIVP